ncbi:MAG: ScpA family protein [Patescibacteria group bacterium]
MSETFKVKVGEFEGPLTLLLELVESQKLPISQVSLARVADDFVAHVRSQQDSSMGSLADFLITASTLMLIKSFSLLPTLKLTESESESVGDLERRLKLYQIIRDLALKLKSEFGAHPIFFAESRRSEVVIFSPTAEITPANLLGVMKNLLVSLPQTQASLPRATVRKVMSLEEMITDLAGRVEKALKMSFSQFVKDQSSDWRQEKVNIIVSFLALLELCKQGRVEVEQGEHFKEISIETKSTSTPRY